MSLSHTRPWAIAKCFLWLLCLTAMPEMAAGQALLLGIAGRREDHGEIAAQNDPSAKRSNRLFLIAYCPFKRGHCWALIYSVAMGSLP